MTVTGDLSTIDLADLLQDIESHSRTGTLRQRSEAGDASLFFRDGRVAMLQRPNRPSLVDMLVGEFDPDEARRSSRDAGPAVAVGRWSRRTPALASCSARSPASTSSPASPASRRVR